LAEDGNPTKQRIVLAATELFAKYGYSAVSVRDISENIGLTAAALYNHFRSKEELWRTIIEQAKSLYHIYLQRLQELCNEAQTFEEILDLVFAEPVRMGNTFTNYAFSIVITEQFRDQEAGEVFRRVFLEESIKCLDSLFAAAVNKGLAKAFDTRLVATLIMNSVIVGIAVNFQVMLGRGAPYNVGKTLTRLKGFVAELGRLD
jgi:AcrR family transcriptional regulator